MFTRNFYRMLTAEYTYTPPNGIINVTGTQITSQLVKSNSSVMSFGYNQSGVIPSLHYVRTTYNGSCGVVFGTGNTPPTMDDYKLSGDIITNIAATVAVTSGITDNGSWIEAKYSISNNGSNDVTIKEIAIFSGTTSTATESYRFIMERTVLDEPVTIPTGGMGQVTYKITMPFPA